MFMVLRTSLSVVYTVSSEVDTGPSDVRRKSKNKSKKHKTKYVCSDSSEYDSKLVR